MNRRTKQGQRDSFNSHPAELLACFLGIDGLRLLTDNECARLIEFLNYLDSIAASEGFKAGQHWQAVYNHDERLLSEGWPTNH